MSLFTKVAKFSGLSLILVSIVMIIWDKPTFTYISALLGGLATLASSYFLKKENGEKVETISMTQKLGDNSKAFQSGRDIVIGKEGQDE